MARLDRPEFSKLLKAGSNPVTHAKMKHITNDKGDIGVAKVTADLL